MLIMIKREKQMIKRTLVDEQISINNIPAGSMLK